MTIDNWHAAHNTVDDFHKEFKSLDDEQLLSIAAEWHGRNPGLAASRILLERKRNRKRIFVGVGIEILIGLLVAVLVIWLAN